MSTKEKYSLLMTICIEHEYYGNSLIPVALIPDTETERNFRKYSITCKRRQNIWYLYGNETLVSYFRQTDDIRFLIQPENSSFFYVTDIQGSEAVNCSLMQKEEPMKNQINITVDSEEVKLKLNSLSKYFEYILFTSKNNHKKIFLKLEDIRNDIEFEDMKILQWGEKDVIQFRSKNKISLIRRNKYNFALVEQTEFGDRILLQNIDSPNPKSLSLYEPYHTVTAYYSL